MARRGGIVLKMGTVFQLIAEFRGNDGRGGVSSLAIRLRVGWKILGNFQLE